MKLMTPQEFLQLLEHNNELVPKRCTKQYLENHDLLSTLDQFIGSDFGTISERIKHLKYGGGFCKSCGTRTRICSSGQGFNDYCSEHFHDAKRGKVAHNKKTIDIEYVKDLYINQNKSLNQISKDLGNISNVSLQKKLLAAGIKLRTHSDCQKIHAQRGILKPKIIINRSHLVYQYSIEKIPTKVLATQYKCDPETIRRFLIQEGVLTHHRTSYIEYQIAKILEKYNISYQRNNRKLISPYELDFFLPEFNIAIETHGLITHSLIAGKKSPPYHKMKYDRCSAQGIRLFQFWEHEINNNLDIIESMIVNACHKNATKINARSCTINNLTWKQLSDFCKENHIQGSPGKNTSGIGLFYQGQLVSVIGILYQKDQTIITRFCSKKFTNVRGGFGKLLNTIEGKIITFSSNDISDGNLYLTTGFVHTASHKNMSYTDYKKVYDRTKFMKHKLPKMFESYDPKLSEIDNMIKFGYDVIYRSGTKTWTKLA